MLRIALFSLVLCTFALSIEISKPLFNLEHATYYFNDFIRTYNKNYSSDAIRQERLKIFTENLKKYNMMNKMDTALHGINQFADLTVEEFLSIYTGLKYTQITSSPCAEITDADIVTKEAPASFDWRQKNMVTPVKDQGRCGSCYAFSSIGNIESQYAIKNNGEQLDLSEQQLVDCTKSNYGCDGGMMTQCMIDVMEFGGLESESDYTYTSVQGSCSFQSSLSKVQLTGCTSYNLNDEDSLKEALYKNGPISIGVAAHDLKDYQGGIIKQCEGEVNHAVLLVGYGSENGQDFWTIKNSWGTLWGEQGFFRILRGQNMCTIMNPIAASAVL